MKVTLDLDALLQAGKITPEEHQRFSQFSSATTHSQAFNLLIAFGVAAVSGAIMALVPKAETSILLGLLSLFGGLWTLRSQDRQWNTLAQFCLVLGALLTGSGILVIGAGSLASMLVVTGLYTLSALLARNGMLSSLAALMLLGCLSAKTGTTSLDTWLQSQELALTIGVFSLLAIGLYKLSRRLSIDYEELFLSPARTSVALVNLHFWVGSLWASPDQSPLLTPPLFAGLWALALAATGLWAWSRNRRWVVNIVASFACLHFYSQWFLHLEAQPMSLLLAGLLALGLAYGLKLLNDLMLRKQAAAPAL